MSCLQEDRCNLQIIKGEFNEWVAKYVLAARTFRKKPTQESCDRFKTLERELGRIAGELKKYRDDQSTERASSTPC